MQEREPQRSVGTVNEIRLAELSLVNNRGVIALNIEHLGITVLFQFPRSQPIPIQDGTDIDILATETGPLCWSRCPAQAVQAPSGERGRGKRYSPGWSERVTRCAAG
jgi:hypothetical protein